MHSTDDKRQQFIRSALTAAGDEAAAEVGGLALRRWHQLAARLVPLVGEGGFSALYVRALRQVGAAYSWLSIEPADKSEKLLAALGGDLAANADQAAAANAALLDAFTAMLAALIGRELTNRVLVSAWNGQDEQETKEMRK
jgi:hypothetical protein